MPISHWCKAATVHTASRCSFGMGVSSKSAMAPPDSSNNHAMIGISPPCPGQWGTVSDRTHYSRWVCLQTG